MFCTLLYRKHSLSASENLACCEQAGATLVSLGKCVGPAFASYRSVLCRSGETQSDSRSSHMRASADVYEAGSIGSSRSHHSTIAARMPEFSSDDEDSKVDGNGTSPSGAPLDGQSAKGNWMRTAKPSRFRIVKSLKHDMWGASPHLQKRLATIQTLPSGQK